VEDTWHNEHEHSVGATPKTEREGKARVERKRRIRLELECQHYLCGDGEMVHGAHIRSITCTKIKTIITVVCF
jgi:hypothetical protein